MIHYSLQVHPAGYRSCKHCSGGGGGGEWRILQSGHLLALKEKLQASMRENTHLAALTRGRRVGYYQGVSVTRRGSGISRRQEGFRVRVQK